MTPTDRWPSPLPGPAWHKWRNCVDYLTDTVFAGVPEATIRAACQTPAVRQAETRAAEMARSGDVLATNASCNAWVRVLKAALAALTAKDAA